MADENSTEERFMDYRQQNVEKRPSIGGQIDALIRDAAKDINNTLHNFFYGQQAGPGEPGTPMNPTPQMVTQDLGTVHGKFDQVMDTYQRPEQKAPEHGMDR